MRIAPATLADLPLLGPGAQEFYGSSHLLRGLGAFQLERFVSFWTALIEGDTGVIFLLWHESEIAGAIGGMAYPDVYSGDLVATEFFWFVRPAHRGAGMDLYREFERWSRERGCKQVRMAFLHDSMPERLTAVYKRLGFHPVETHWVKEMSHV